MVYHGDTTTAENHCSNEMISLWSVNDFCWDQRLAAMGLQWVFRHLTIGITGFLNILNKPQTDGHEITRAI